jgi:hypothetical protein
LKTDLSQTAASKDVVHDRYKDLALVEWAFRESKTVHLEDETRQRPAGNADTRPHLRRHAGVQYHLRSGATSILQFRKVLISLLPSV